MEQTRETIVTEIGFRASHNASIPLMGHSCLGKMSGSLSINTELPVDPTIPLQGIYSREIKTYSQVELATHVHNNIFNI